MEKTSALVIFLVVVIFLGGLFYQSHELKSMSQDIQELDNKIAAMDTRILDINKQLPDMIAQTRKPTDKEMIGHVIERLVTESLVPTQNSPQSQMKNAHGSACSNQLDILYSACEQIAFKLNAGPNEAWPAAGAHASINPYLRFKIEDGCPAGGRYTLGGTITDSNSRVIVPTCSLENDDPNGNGVLNRMKGLHIHRRSFIDGARNPDLTFAR
jgi:hypothetical protein